MRNRIIIFLTFLSLTSLNSLAQKTVFPDTNAGKRASAFWTLVKTKDKETVTKFINNEMLAKKDVTAAQRIDVFGQVRSILGTSDIKKVVRASNSKISFVAVDPQGRLRLISITLAPGGRIDQIGLRRATDDDLSDEIQRVLSGSELVDEVDKYLAGLESKDEFSGTVLVAKNGKPIYKKAIGYANLSDRVPNKIDTKFNTGSIDKTFTQLAIGMLIDEGKISFDDKLGKFLPKYANKNAREKVNVRHLLTMTSGIVDFFGQKFFGTSKRQFRTLEAYLPMFESKPLLFEPGTSRRYSNGSYILLGLIIEKASGKSYFDFVRDRIYKPLGMNNTYAFENDVPTPNRATGYTLNGVTDKESKSRVSNVLMIPVKGSSGGGGYSTVEDLLKFVNGLESGKLKVPDSIKGMYGYTRGMGIAGGAPGLNAAVETKIGGNHTIIVMTNYDPADCRNSGGKNQTLAGTRGLICDYFQNCLGLFL